MTASIVDGRTRAPRQRHAEADVLGRPLTTAIDGDANASAPGRIAAGQLWGRLAERNERKHRSEWVARHDYDGEVCRRAVRQHDCERNHTYRMSDSDDERRLQRRDAESIFYGLTSIDDE